MQSNSGFRDRFRSLFVALVALVLVTTACGSPAGENGDGHGAPGQRLLVQGGGIVQSLRLSGNPGWNTEFEFTIQDAFPAVNTQAGQFHMARTPTTELFTVETYALNDLDTATSEFTWPETELAAYFRGLALSPSGSYVAAVIRQGPSDRLSIVSLQGNQAALVSVHDFSGKLGSDLAWLDDETLVFGLDVRDQTDGAAAEYAGAIVALDVAGAEQTGALALDIFVGFTAAEWSGLSAVGGFAVSPDGQRLVYSYGQNGRGDLWVRSTQNDGTGPVQLTSGTHPHIGAAFSPDGSSLAFVEYIEGYVSTVFVIPSNPEMTLNLDDHATWNQHRVTDGRARRILAWY